MHSSLFTVIIPLIWIEETAAYTYLVRFGLKCSRFLITVIGKMLTTLIEL